MSNRTYFLGCPTPDGFETHFSDEIRSGRYLTYIIKGGPGTGKSTVMKRLASALGDTGPVELYYCSSDPSSLDAVIFRGLGVIFVDGTSPHVFEPKYPGARERLLDLGRFWDSEKLRSRADEIIKLSDENSKLHERVRRYLGAISSLGADISAAGEAALLSQKLESYAGRLSAKLFPKKPGRRGEIALRQITSLTPKGVITQEAAFEGMKRYVISDPCLSVTDALLKRVSQLAASAGYDVIASKNVFLPGCAYEQVLVPEANVALLSQGKEPSEAVINALRFYDRELLRERRRRIAFNAGLRREMIAAAVDTLSEAKSVHDSLERIYIEAMNFSAVEAMTEELIERLKG